MIIQAEKFLILECSKTYLENGYFVVSNIIAGSKIEKDTYTYDDRPNKAPEACGVRVYYEYDDYTTTVDYENANIQTSCITGHIGCLGEEDLYTMLGTYENKDECEISDIPSNNVLMKQQNTHFLSTFWNTPKSKISHLVLSSSIVLLLIYGLYHYYFSMKRKYNSDNVEINYHLISNGNSNYGSI